jgi:hypothetical protein
MADVELDEDTTAVMAVEIVMDAEEAADMVVEADADMAAEDTTMGTSRPTTIKTKEEDSTTM